MDLGALLAAATVLRSWLKTTSFSDGGAIVRSARQNTGARALVTFALGLRENRTSRKTWNTFLTDYDDAAKVWVPGFLRSLFALWSTMHVLCVPRQTEDRPEHPAFATVTKEQRLLISGAGLLRPRKIPIKEVAKTSLASLMTSLEDSQAVVHCDNYSILRYTSNPGTDKNKSIAACSFAILKVLQIPDYRGLPRAELLMDAVPRQAAAMPDIARGFEEAVSRVANLGFVYADIRAPLDIVRLDVKRSPWEPWQIADIDTKQGVGMAKALEVVDGLRAHTRTPTLPVLCDIDIYWRFLKMAYGASYLDLNVRALLKQHPLNFGVWHAYKQAVGEVYYAFFPFFAFLEYPGFREDPAAVDVTNFPKLILKERMVASLLLALPVLRPRVEQARQQADAVRHESPERARQAQQMDALWYLLTQYVPALFHLGYLVRECNWNGRRTFSGAAGHEVISAAWLVLLGLGKRVGPYFQRLGVALLLWTPYHTHAPAAFHCEEVLEAMLSRLAKAMNRHLTVFEVNEINVLFRTMRPPSMESMDMKRPNLDKKLVERVKEGLNALVHAIRLGNLGYIKKASKGGTVRGSKTWPVRHTWPGPLHAPLSVSDFTGFLEGGMKALMRPSVRSPETSTILERILHRNNLPSRTPAQIQRVQEYYTSVIGNPKKRKRGDAPARRKGRSRDVGVQFPEPERRAQECSQTRDPILVHSSGEGGSDEEGDTDSDSCSDGEGERAEEEVDDWEPLYDSENAHVE